MQTNVRLSRAAVQAGGTVRSFGESQVLQLTPALQESERALSGSHAHALTGEQYAYTARYKLLGTMIDWQAQVQAGDNAGARVAGSIRLSRGQTHHVAPTLVNLMVAQAIDRLGSEAAAA